MIGLDYDQDAGLVNRPVGRRSPKLGREFVDYV
jgi:hypothetical protein